MNFFEAKEIKDKNCALISANNPSVIWWVDDEDIDSHLKYSAAEYDGENIPKYRTRFTEYSMISNGGANVDYDKIKVQFDLNKIPLYEAIQS